MNKGDRRLSIPLYLACGIINLGDFFCLYLIKCFGKMTQENDFEAKEAKVRLFLQEQAQRTIALRSKDREFHGLEREFIYHQEQMRVDYNRTRDLKHPRDIGSSRENILRKFLTDSGYLTKRYLISDRSVRVVSPTGHISNEIDIAIYDSLDSLTLMKREDVYEVYPIESVYGVIQVKSSLTKKELKSALKNIESFKKLDHSLARPIFSTNRNFSKSKKGFGIIFAYSSSMKWKEIADQISDYSRRNSSCNCPNALFILDRGYFLFGNGLQGVFKNEDIESLDPLKVHGFPDRTNGCLFNLTIILLELLRSTAIYEAPIENYFKLPLIAHDYSYRFIREFSEVGVCEKHGDYARKILPESIDKIVQWCHNAESINPIKAINIAYNIPEDEEAYQRQPGEVYIYNPKNLPLREILTSNEEGNLYIAYDDIDANGIRIFLPFYYSERENLISSCPKCTNNRRRREKRV